VRTTVEQEWGRGLIRSWNTGWYQATARLGDKIGQLIGAGPGQVLVSDSTSVNLFKLAMAALGLRPERDGIVSDALNFPTDLYVLESCVRLLGGRHRLHLIASPDGMTADQAALLAALDNRTALLTLSHVAFKSAYLYDAVTVTRRAHQAGA